MDGPSPAERNAMAQRLISRNRLPEALDLLNETIRQDPRLAATFENRGTEIDVNPVALRSEFFDSPQTVRQWSAFRDRGLGEEAPESLGLVADQIRAFLLPPAESLAAGRQFSLRWSAPGPWE